MVDGGSSKQEGHSNPAGVTFRPMMRVKNTNRYHVPESLAASENEGSRRASLSCSNDLRILQLPERKVNPQENEHFGVHLPILFEISSCTFRSVAHEELLALGVGPAGPCYHRLGGPEQAAYGTTCPRIRVRYESADQKVSTLRGPTCCGEQQMTVSTSNSRGLHQLRFTRCALQCR